jgi:hypothetical protein
MLELLLKEMTPERVAGLAGVLLAIGLERVPGLSDWFGALQPSQKAGLMALLTGLVVLVVFSASCGGVATAMTCDVAGGVRALDIWFVSLGTNQATHLLTKKRKAQ